MPLGPFGEFTEHLGHLLARAAVEHGEGFLALRGKGEDAPAPVGL
jgi:hypothetical protein